MVQRLYSLPYLGRAFLELVGSLGQDDVLVVPNLAFETTDHRQALFRTLLVRDIRLRVLHVAPEYEAEFASFKADFRRARFERAKARGAYANCGRPRTIDRAAIQNLNAKGMSPAAITRELGGAVGRSTVYRISKELKAAA